MLPLPLASHIVKSLITTCPVPLIRKEIEKRSCLLVKKCVLGVTCKFLASYFKVNNHRKYIRNGGLMVFQPHAKLEFGKGGFIYQELVYNITPCYSKLENAILLLILSNL